ncbi:MAG: phasin family protein [Gammaproteobacteria bacterium]|nr:phasin family protein [Gammaproteobacteria bacterium]
MTTKKVTRKKAAPKKAPTMLENLESTFVGKPIQIANRTFLASLGLVATVQNEFTKFQADFEKTYEKLVKDGEKARDRYRKNFVEARKDVKEFGEDVREAGEDLVRDVVDEATDIKDRVVERFETAATG